MPRDRIPRPSAQSDSAAPETEAEQASGGGARPSARALLGASGGMPLPQNVRREMEAHFRAPFHRVRVHKGGQAGAFGADGMTVGERIFLPHGHDDLASDDGKHLLAHELTHVLQQRSGRVRATGPGVQVDPDARLEREAQAAAHSIESGQAPVLGRGGGGGGGTVVQRRKRKKAAVHHRAANALADRMGVDKDPASPMGQVAGHFLRQGLGKGMRAMRGEAGSLRHLVTGHLMGKAMGDKPAEGKEQGGKEQGGKEQGGGLMGAIFRHYRDGIANRFKKSPAYAAFSQARKIWNRADRRRTQQQRGDAVRAERAERRNPKEQEMQDMGGSMFGTMFDEPIEAPIDAKNAVAPPAQVRDGGQQPPKGFAQDNDRQEVEP